MKYGIASDDYEDDRDEVFHYVRDGEEKTVCGLFPHSVYAEKRKAIRGCIRCERAIDNHA